MSFLKKIAVTRRPTSSFLLQVINLPFHKMRYNIFHFFYTTDAFIGQMIDLLSNLNVFFLLSTFPRNFHFTIAPHVHFLI